MLLLCLPSSGHWFLGFTLLFSALGLGSYYYTIGGGGTFAIPFKSKLVPASLRLPASPLTVDDYSDLESELDKIRQEIDSFEKLNKNRVQTLRSKCQTIAEKLSEPRAHVDQPPPPCSAIAPLDELEYEKTLSQTILTYDPDKTSKSTDTWLDYFKGSVPSGRGMGFSNYNPWLSWIPTFGIWRIPF